MSAAPYVRLQRAWKEYNGARIERARQTAPEPSRLAFSVIPFLLHHNIPGLPGFTDKGTLSHGIWLYESQERPLEPVRKSFGVVNENLLREGAPTGKFAIHSLLLMGSIGTVAQTGASDYDYWVVIDEKDLTPVDLAALTARLAAIETWAAGQKLEVHFFLSDVTRTRANDFGATDKESSGTTQANLLKEEFYRTAILVAGKDPLWWVLPPALSDADYAAHKEELLLDGHLDETDVVDLGNARPVPEEEYFGAILWQFNKALGSPYKSALKMALTESLKEDEPAFLLCDRLKRRIQGDKKPGDFDTDPYLMMMEEVDGFYRKKGMPEAATTLQKCFFLKSFDKPVTDAADHANLIYKERALRAALRSWGWSGPVLYAMNTFQTWEFRQISALANALHNFMILLYKRINSEVTQESAVKSMISDADLTVIGRKLFTLYAKKDHKIEYLKRVKDEYQGVEAVSFVVNDKKGAQPLWSLYHGNVIAQVKRNLAVEHLALRSSRDPVELIQWLVTNGVAGKNTFFYLEPGGSPVSLADLQQLAQKMMALFPVIDLTALAAEDLLSAARVTRVMLTVNLTSHRWIDKIETLHVSWQTSWGESFCESQSGVAGLQRALEVLTKTPASFALGDPARFDLFVPKGDKAAKLKKEVGDFIASRYLALRRKAAASP
ncbi:MAG: class I adenylate cyclase [Nitrospinae bacterium]|nr:class I adenylate cyclase [Nitrospinota bacterium]